MKSYLVKIALAAVFLIVCLTGGSLLSENNKTKSEENKLKEYKATLELVKDMNQNSDFGGLELLKFSDKTVENQQTQEATDILPDFAEEEKDGVEGIYFNYPKDSDDYRLAKISITVIPYHVYGITVGQKLKDATWILEEKGFTEQEKLSDNDVDFILYRQHHASISIKVDKDTGIIRTIIVSVYDKLDDTVY